MGFYKPVYQYLRPSVKSFLAILRWKRWNFVDLPPMFGNSKPKSGSHLLLQILNGFCRIMPYRYVDVEPIRTITRQGIRRTQSDILEDLRHIPAGVIGWGYLDPTPENVQFLCARDRVNYFIYRDPRDMLVSQVYYATDLHEEHGMHAYYQSLADFSARLRVAITGIDKNGAKMVSVRQRYESVFRWLEQDNVLCIRFEDLMENRDDVLESMLAELQKTGYEIPTQRGQPVSVLKAAIQPRKSRTFRSGKTGAWREHFRDEHKVLFKDVAGDLLVRLGYEKNNDW